MEQLRLDYKSATLISDAERAMLRYAEKLTRTPWAAEESDIANLRQHGFSDQAILEVNLVASYMNFVNRIAEGLGVELEDFFKTFTR